METLKNLLFYLSRYTPYEECLLKKYLPFKRHLGKGEMKMMWNLCDVEKVNRNALLLIRITNKY